MNAMWIEKDSAVAKRYQKTKARAYLMHGPRTGCKFYEVKILEALGSRGSKIYWVMCRHGNTMDPFGRILLLRTFETETEATSFLNKVTDKKIKKGYKTFTRPEPKTRVGRQKIQKQVQKPGHLKTVKTTIDLEDIF